MAGLHFDITGDNSNFLRKLEESRNGVRSTSKQIEDSGMSIEQMFGRMTTTAAAFGVSLGAKQLVSDITRVRGEFQQLEVAFNTMLGSKEQADTLMSQLVKTAAITPFDLQGVANGAKQLLAYGTAAEDVNETLVRLGDIAAGLSIPLNDLVWLYGTTMTQGRLFTQDLRQFQGRGIPLANELAKQFGVAKDKVGELVTAGKVGFPEVQKAIEAMTNEGGKFGGLMEDQSKTITGQISNIEDAISTMFNQIGKENEGIINGALSSASYLVEHWQEVAIAIESAAIAYGTYKAAVMTTAALQGAEQTLKVDAEIEGLKSLLVIKEESKNADIAAAVASGRLTESKAAELTMLREELALKISSLQAQNALAEKEYANALLNATAAENRLQSAQDAVDGMDDWIARAEDLGNTELANTYRIQLAEKSTELQSAAIARNSAQKALNDAATKKKSSSEALSTVTTQANTIANHANTASMNIMKLAAIQLTTILKGMWTTLMANPLLLVTGAFIGLSFAVYKVATAESEAEKATRLYNKAIDEQQKKQDEYKENIDKLVKAIDDSTKSEGERLQAFEALKAEYPTIFNNLLTEAEYLKEIAKYKKLIAEEDNNRAKKSDEAILEREKQKLEYYQRVRKNGTSTTLVDMDGNGWATDNVEYAIKAQQNVVNKAIAKVANRNVASFLVNIKDMKNEDIVSVIDGINNSLKALGKSGDDAIAVVAELGGEFSKQQLSTIKNALETEQNARSAEKNTGKEWVEKYKNNYLAAKKELDDFLNTNNSLTEIEYERKLKELTDAKDEAEKKYKSVGGITGNKANTEADKQLKQQEQLSEQLLSLRRKNQQEEINLMADGTDKKLAQIDLDYRKELDAIRKQEQEWSKTNGGKLTEEQSVQISLSYSQAESKRGKSISEVNKEALEAMNRYLKEYGTFQQKKEAITKEYNEKIAKATTEGDKKILQKEMEEALSSVDMDKLKQEINWELIFSDLSKVSKKSLEQVKQQLKAFKSSGEYKNMAVDQKKVIDEALNNIQSTIIDKGGLLGDLPEQLDALRIAQEELKQAQDEYNKALKTGTDAEKEAALKKKNNAEKNVQNAETNVTKSADKTKQNLITLADTITQLGSSSEMSLSQTGNLASGLVDVFSEAGSKLGGIIGAAFSLLDGIEKQGLDGFVENVFSSVFRAGASMWDTITFGAFSKLTGSGESDKNLEKDLEYLAQSNQDLKNSLDNLSEKMDKASVADASDIYAVQKKNIETLEANTREAMQRSAAAYNNGFLGIGGSHSSGSKINKGMSTSEWKRVSDIVGQSVSSAGQFFRLSSEQMAKLAEEDTSLYSKIKDLANNGYKDAAQYMDEYITYYKQLEELENAYNEKLTNTSFDSIRNDFKNALLDMESDAEDFADNFEKMMQNAIVESLMTKKYDKLLQEWYSDFAKAMEGDGKISENEQVSLKRQWENITKQAIAERDALKEVMGWESESESTRTASQKGIATASQDSVNENNGRLAVMQGHTYSINENVTRMATGIDTIANHTANLSCLTNIDKTMQSILSMRDAALTHLSNIDGHTSRLEAIEDAIVFMKNDINTMLIKGLKLSKN